MKNNRMLSNRMLAVCMICFFLQPWRLSAFSNVVFGPKLRVLQVQSAAKSHDDNTSILQVKLRSTPIRSTTKTATSLAMSEFSMSSTNTGTNDATSKMKSRFYRALPVLATVLALPVSFWASSIMSNISRFYKAYPLVAGFMTCAIKACAADRMAQWRDVCTDKFCLRRNISMVLYSGIVLGVTVEIMYNSVFPWMFGVESSMAKVIKMTLFDGLINAPLLWLPPAYLMQALISRYPKREALEKYVRDVRENGLLTKYWSLWLPASFLNFLVVPPHFRVSFVAAVSFFWMIILSLVANNTQDPASCPVDENEPVLLNPRAFD